MNGVFEPQKIISGLKNIGTVRNLWKQERLSRVMPDNGRYFFSFFCRLKVLLKHVCF
ncbi:hypothetical protein DCCM_0655 [Desulfocucumis palustris]|uniref:Uncharacterized protein n=1 Tax=Desulfocucumis palustris TaxID=1898651 RepID=A0A2L2X8C3_9FIRM|nr:hypothetical protein DCCM_0655 [Desulfocucumis palustris]